MSVSDRVKSLIELGETLVANAEDKRGLLMVDRGRYTEFRSSALSVLKAQFGADHPHFTNFEQHVTSSAASRVQAGLGVLRAAAADLQQPLRRVAPSSGIQFEDLLHPVIVDAALEHFANEHYREAILNSVIAVFDLLRDRTGLAGDGPNLVTEALALDRPKLIITELDTESGKNEQKGTIQLLQGAYAAIRNPKAHTLLHSPSRHVAAQYMVFASLLARRIAEARFPAAG